MVNKFKEDNSKYLQSFTFAKAVKQQSKILLGIHFINKLSDVYIEILYLTTKTALCSDKISCL